MRKVVSPIAAGPLWSIKAKKITRCREVAFETSLNAADPNANPSDKEWTTRPSVDIMS